MLPSRTPAAAARSRSGLVSLLTVSIAAGVAAAAADLSARGARPLPAALEFTALLASVGALRLVRRAGPSRTGDAGSAGSAETATATAASNTSTNTHATPAWTPPGPPWPPQPVPKPASIPAPRSAPAPERPPTPAAPSAPSAPAVPLDDPHAGARRAFVNLARRIQAAVNRQLRELRELEARHGADPEVFGDLLQIDHATALIGRLADSLAVLGGDRPARRWQRPIPLVSVLRGAMSRITEYRRVEIGPLPERVGVDGGAVEALVHALAELLDNATRYSPPDSRVRLGARAADGGCVIEVVDAGVGLTPAAAQRAEFVLRTRDFGLELASLGESPRLGLAVVGRLAHATGFEASLHRADGGGVRAELLVPARLLCNLPAKDLEPAKPEQRPHSHRAAQPGAAPASGTEPSTVAGTTAHGLPQRRRVLPDPSKKPPDPGAQPAVARERGGTAPAAPGLWLTAFQAGLRGEPGDEGTSREDDGRNPA